MEFLFLEHFALAVTLHFQSPLSDWRTLEIHRCLTSFLAHLKIIAKPSEADRQELQVNLNLRRYFDFGPIASKMCQITLLNRKF